jgi:hypothetical protein
MLNDRDTHGRESTGVTQGEPGLDYPLVSPSENVRYLLADLNICIEKRNVTSPLRIYWLKGFGEATGDTVSSGYQPVSTHAQDIVIMDAANQVVFDSTVAGMSHETREWTDRISVTMWRHATIGTVTVVWHTAWNYNLDPVPFTYKSAFFPNAVIDERTVTILPDRLRSLTVVLDNFRRTGVEFHAGYNVSITPDYPTPVDGGRQVTRLNFVATPGAGLGLFPGCEPEPLVIRTFNGVGPTTEGDFFMSATDCYWVRRPTVVVGAGVTLPTNEVLPGSSPTSNLPHPAAGSARNLPGWPTNGSPALAHLQVGNDCIACCDCPDYVDAANYLNYVRDRYHAVGVGFETSRDQYHVNRERWLAAADCFTRYPLRVRMLAQVCPFLDIAIQFCNQTQECKTDVLMTITFTSSPGGAIAEEVPGYTFIKGGSTVPGRRTVVEERVQMTGSWPTFSAYFDAVQPSQSVYARFRLKFGNCGVATVGSSNAVPFAITGCVNATVGGRPLLVKDAETAIQNVVAEACETRTLNCPQPAGSTSNLLICACERE